MGLRDYQPEFYEKKVGSASIRVQALSLVSLSVLVKTHINDLEAIFDLMQARKGDLQREDLATVATALISQAPGLVANIIALAANAPEDADKVEQMSFGLQAELLEKVGELTFKESGGVKKSTETIARLLMTTNLSGKLKLTKNPTTD